jgi:hypothetical protein
MNTELLYFTFSSSQVNFTLHRYIQSYLSLSPQYWRRWNQSGNHSSLVWFEAHLPKAVLIFIELRGKSMSFSYLIFIFKMQYFSKRGNLEILFLETKREEVGLCQHSIPDWL